MMGREADSGRTFALPVDALVQTFAFMGIRGSGKCVEASEKILLSDGRVEPAHTLIGRTFSILGIGDKGEFVPRIAHAADNGMRGTYLVRTRSGREILRTAEHPLWAAEVVTEYTRPKIKKVGWVAVQNLVACGWGESRDRKMVHAVAVPTSIPINGNRPRNDDEVKLAAYLVGDGGTTCSVSFTHLPGPALDEFVEIAHRLGGKVHCSKSASKAVQLRVSGASNLDGRGSKGSNPVLELVKSWGLFGVKSKHKSFPSWVWELPDRQIALFLNRLLSCDGWALTTTHGRSDIGICSASYALIRDVELAMLRLGIPGSINRKTVKGVWKTTPGDYIAYTWNIGSREALATFVARVGIFGKEQQVAKAVPHNGGAGWKRTWTAVDDMPGMRWDFVERVQCIGERPTVSISVPGDERFVTTFLEHNTTAVAVLAEEFSKAGLPWIMLDPVGVGWGLRAGKDGKSGGGFPVVVFGGSHGDLPLDKDGGRKVAEALIESNVCAVIDLSKESKKTWRRFLTDFCLALMDLNPQTPRHLFIEEAAEFIPQRTKVAVTAECKEAVERLVRLGRNQGYGCSIITQRPATVDKDVLSQCENLVVMRTVGKHDRRALMDWLEPKFSEQGLDEKGVRAEGTKLVNTLAAFDSGVAYFWSPHWLKQFKKVRIRDRATFHPGQTRSVGKSIGPVALSDVTEFVERVRRQLSASKPASVPQSYTPRKIESLKKEIKSIETSSGSAIVLDPVTSRQAAEAIRDVAREADELRQRVGELQKQIAEEKARRADAENRLAAVRKFMEPQYETMKKLFEKLGTPGSNGAADSSVYAPWLEKAGKRGSKRLLEIMIARGEVTRTQLATLAGIAQSGTFRNYLSWLKSNGLVEVQGEQVRLRPI